MNVKQYVGDIIGGSLFILESRTIAELLLEKPGDAEFKRVVEEDNIMQKNSAQTAIRYARTIRLRIEPMGESYLELLIRANETSAKQLLMAAFLRQSPLAIDFMRYKLADSRRMFEERLSDYAWSDFIDERARLIPELANFSESSIKKMGNNMMKALADAGYLNTARQKRLQAVYLDPDVQSWLVQNGFEKLAQVMEV